MKQVAATVLSRVRSVAQDCSCGGCADGKLYCEWDRIPGAQAPCAGGVKWDGFPESRKEFTSLATFRTHDLDLLLALSGREQRIKSRHFAEWYGVAAWDPEVRYRTPGSTTKADADLLVSSAEVLLKAL